MELLKDGEDIDYDGVSGPVDLNETGSPSKATIGIFQYDADNTVQEPRVRHRRRSESPCTDMHRHRRARPSAGPFCVLVGGLAPAAVVAPARRRCVDRRPDSSDARQCLASLSAVSGSGRQCSLGERAEVELDHLGVVGEVACRCRCRRCGPGRGRSARSQICRQRRAFCSTMTTETPARLIRRVWTKTSSCMSGGQAGGGLVEQQHRRLHHQRAAHRHHLALTAGQRAGPLVLAVRRAREELGDEVEPLLELLRASGRRPSRGSPRWSATGRRCWSAARSRRPRRPAGRRAGW